MEIDFDLYLVPTPYYIVDEKLLIRNLEILRHVSHQTGARILLAQKAFSMFSLYPLIGQYLSGTAASGLFEARLGHEEMGKETHIFSPAYRMSDIDDILAVCDHVIFNSFSQWALFREKALQAGKKCGMRINPECSTQEHAIYDTCAPGSRLGVTAATWQKDQLDGISGLHFHTLCEQNADDLVRTLEAVEEKFGAYLHQMEWLNIGGGHHITREDYDVPLLIHTINRLKDTYHVEIYVEPGEAVALQTGYLVSEVVDILENGRDIAIMDASAACHMPDVLEMPYRPEIIKAGKPQEKPFTYLLGGPTCLAGDVIGEYSFDRPLKRGDRLVFSDMAHYTMVKNNTFNGIGLPAIAAVDTDRRVRVIRSFGYEDFKGRLS